MIPCLIARQLSRPTALFSGLAAMLWNRRNSALNDTALEALALAPEDRVLEVGFGGGYLLGRMAEIVSNGHLAGLDISPAMVSGCQRRFTHLVHTGLMELHVGPVEQLPFSDGIYTKAVSVNSIFYWQDARQALKELARVLAPDGLLVLCFTCRQSLESRSFADYIQTFEGSDVAALMSSAGFSDVTIQKASDCHRDYALVSGKNSL